MTKPNFDRYTLRDLRYVDKDGNVHLRKEIAKDVVKPDPVKLAKFFKQS